MTCATFPWHLNQLYLLIWHAPWLWGGTAMNQSIITIINVENAPWRTTCLVDTIILERITDVKQGITVLIFKKKIGNKYHQNTKIIPVNWMSCSLRVFRHLWWNERYWFWRAKRCSYSFIFMCILHPSPLSSFREHVDSKGEELSSFTSFDPFELKRIFYSPMLSALW